MYSKSVLLLSGGAPSNSMLKESEILLAYKANQYKISLHPWSSEKQEDSTRVFSHWGNDCWLRKSQSLKNYDQNLMSLN